MVQLSPRVLGDLTGDKRAVRPAVSGHRGVPEERPVMVPLIAVAAFATGVLAVAGALLVSGHGVPPWIPAAGILLLGSSGVILVSAHRSNGAACRAEGAADAGENSAAVTDLRDRMRGEDTPPGRESPAVDAARHVGLPARNVAAQRLTGSASEPVWLSHLVESIPVAIAMFDTGMRYLAASRRYVSDYRLDRETPGSLAGRSHYEVFPEIPDRWRDVHRRVLAGETLGSEQDPFPRIDGQTDWLQWEMAPWHQPDGTIGGAILVSTFVTARRQAEEALAISEQRYRAALKGPPVVVFEQDRDLRFTWIDNPPLGTRPEDVIGRTDADLCEAAEDAAALTALKRRVIDSGKGVREEVRVRLLGSDLFFTLSLEPLRDAGGATTGLSGTALDVTAHRRIEAALRESETRLRVAAEAAGMGIFDVDLLTGEANWSTEMFDLLGIAPTPDLRSHTNLWGECVHPDDLAATEAARRRTMAEGGPYHAVYRVRRASDGVERWMEGYGRPNGPPGQATRLIGVMFDITERKRAEAILRDSNAELELRVAERTRALSDAGRELQAEMRRREEAQASLLQTQKLEALGQLTGGVAHDFNNVLAAILGSFDLLSARISDERLRRFVDIGERAARRAEALVRQLLAFARREQLTPVYIEPDSLLRENASLIRHAAGPRVSYTLVVAPDTWPILADVRQLEVALLNLTVNARDAMPDGGELRIATRNVPADGDAEAGTRPAQLPPGDYVVLAVHDTGAGMSPEVLARATEPFFTTKEAGKGTGLGLAMVHGFVLQSGGALHIHSVRGDGTLVEIWLPRAAARMAEPDGPQPAIDPGLHGDATILVVDDDDQVRPVTAGFLRDLGYTVIEAANAEAAEVLAHAAGCVDLAVTDVVMPGADGPALAARLRAEWPGLPVLFVTGHADRTRLEGEAVLAKPFTGAELGRRVLECLGRGDGTTGETLLAARLRTPKLRQAYQAWRRARKPGRLPAAAEFNLADLPVAADAFLVAVSQTPEAPRFTYVAVGAALTSRLGQALDGSAPVADDALGSLEDGYRRCMHTGVPTYEYARYRIGNEAPVLFERLLLPLSDDGKMVTHIAGVALFVNIPVDV